MNSLTGDLFVLGRLGRRGLVVAEASPQVGRGREGALSNMEPPQVDGNDTAVLNDPLQRKGKQRVRLPSEARKAKIKRRRRQGLQFRVRGVK